MSERRGVRVRIHEDGALTFVDPDPSVLPLIQEFDPSFTVRQEPLPGFCAPQLLVTASMPSGIARSGLPTCVSGELWKAHDDAAKLRSLRVDDEASMLDLKIELARRMLRDCELCGVRCRVNRTKGELGRCGLGTEAFVYEAYVHIAEEPPVNPSLNISLRGCGMRCRYCQQFEALHPRGPATDVLGPATWDRVELAGARSLTFIGGNPTESLPSVLEFLAAAPSGFALPVVWNSAAYDSVEALRLLRGVCDAFIPDWKYGNDQCATALSNAPDYIRVAGNALDEMCRHGVPVFVRMLVLPGHVECCHLPSLQLLAPLRAKIRLNVMSQYHPDFLIRPSDGAMGRRVLPEEVARVRDAANRLGFDVMGTHDRRPMAIDARRNQR